MIVRLVRPLVLLCLLVSAALPVGVGAQDDAPRFESPTLGVSFALPAGWTVYETEDTLLTGADADVAAVREGGVPIGLTVRMVFGTFNQLGITDATQIPAMLQRLVPPEGEASDPQAVQWGNASGYQTEVVLPEEQLTTRVALLAIAGGRVAVVRGIAPGPIWQTQALPTFQALMASLEFRLPERDADYITRIPSNDGGVLWHYIAPPPESGREVRAGGIVYDMFDVMYMVVGAGGVMSLDMNSGARISYMGPWLGGNFVDVAIGPDTKLYMANVAAETDQAIMVVDRAGNWARGWGGRGDGAGEFAPGMPRTIAINSNGDVWAISEGHSAGLTNRLYKFDAYGNLLLSLDLAALNPDLHDVRLAIHPQTDALYLVGAAGNLTVADENGQALVVNLGQEVLQGLRPRDIAIAPNGNIVLALDAPGLDGFGFLELSAAGRLLDVFGFPFDEERGGPFLPGEYAHPAGLLIGPDGTGYWTETHPQTGYTQVQHFTFRGDGVLPLGREALADQGAEADLLGSSDPALGGGTIAYGQSVKGTLNNRYPSHHWTFEGEAGDHVIIAMMDASGAGLLDPKLRLLTADEREIAANDDVGAARPEGMGERDAYIDFYLPSDGVYTIEAGRFGGRGEYVLTLKRVSG